MQVVHYSITRPSIDPLTATQSNIDTCWTYSHSPTPPAWGTRHVVFRGEQQHGQTQPRSPRILHRNWRQASVIVLGVRTLAELDDLLARLEDAPSEAERMPFDADFHREILEALRARDPERAEAAALTHVATTEAWFRARDAE